MQIFDKKLIKSVAIISLVYFLLFNTFIVLHKLNYLKAGSYKAILEITKDFIYVYIASYIIFLGLSINRWVLIIGGGFLFLTGAISAYYLYALKIPISKSIIESVFYTDHNDAKEFISIRMLYAVIGSMGFFSLLIYHLKIKSSKIKCHYILSSVALVILISNIIQPKYRLMTSYFPLNYLHYTYKCTHEYFKFSKIRRNISKEFKFDDKSDDNLVAVLIIGEAARYDHFGINGYHRNNTPKIQSTANLITIKGKSNSACTHTSVVSFLSRLDNTHTQKEILSETSILSIFKSLGFQTIWISMQSYMKYLRRSHGTSSIYDETTFSLIPGGSALYQVGSHDEVMLPYFNDMLEQPGKKFIVLHTAGSHWDYMSRYPKQFERFTPICNKDLEFLTNRDYCSCQHDEIINMYDNSIYYTDHFISQVINKLKNKNAFLLYTSDHGESLGEHGRYGHGGDDLLEEQTTVPFIFWMSDQFIKKNHNSYKNMITHNNHELNHDAIFHTLLDCANISSEIIDKKYSICSKK